MPSSVHALSASSYVAFFGKHLPEDLVFVLHFTSHLESTSLAREHQRTDAVVVSSCLAVLCHFPDRRHPSVTKCWLPGVGGDEGEAVGADVGPDVGAGVGFAEGDPVGDTVGLGVRDELGA